MRIVEVTPDNALKETFFCIKDKKKDGFKDKLQWFEKRYKEGLKIKILKSDEDKMIGFIEYVPAKNAWRPIDADNYLFIHCLYIYSKKEREIRLPDLSYKYVLMENSLLYAISTQRMDIFQIR